MSLAQEIYIQFVDHFSTLEDAALLKVAEKSKSNVSYHNQSLLLALKDVIVARGL